MPFGDADNTKINPDLLPDGDDVKAGEDMEAYLQRVFDGNDGEVAFGNGQSSRNTTSESTDVEAPADAPHVEDKAQPTAPAPAHADDAGTEGASEPTTSPELSGADTPTPYPNTASEAVQSPFDVIEFQGRQITRTQAEALLNVLEWANSNPNGAAVMDAYMQGQIQFDPSGKLVPAEGAVPATPTQPASAPPSTTPTITPTDNYPGLDPVVADRLRALETVAQYTIQSQQQAEQSRLRQQQQSDEAAVTAGVTEFQAKYQLTPEQTQLLTNIAASAQIFPGIRERSADTKSAITTTLEMAFWATPQFRDAEINRQASGINNQTTRQDKQAKLIGASGGVGSAPRRVDSTITPSKDKNERQAQMADVIARELNGASATN